ncbi:MAG: ECF transporter S component [Synergistaceae bacterium]|jgi:uncharacterized repeat protein (TIGR04002 family)|nr:ECF transporter S component [Synergistaceae bacterium]
MNEKFSIRNIVLAGLFTAMIFVVTYFPRIPTARGYIHIGDSVIYVAACLLNHPAAAISAALGGFLTDALSGYVAWAPYTAIIKAALTIPFTAMGARMLSLRNFLAALAAFPITIGGYYLAAWMITGDRFVPLAEVPFNAVQAGVSMLIFIAVAAGMDKAGLKNRLAGPSAGGK